MELKELPLQLKRTKNYQVNSNKFQRMENETDTQLLFRICQLKDEIGSWQDVADILNDITGKEYNESTYRKKYNDFVRLYSQNRERLGDTREEIEELKRKEEEIRKERIKLQTLNLERGKYDRAMARQELYYENIGSLVATLPLPDFAPIEKSYPEEMKYVLTIADVHYGAKFKSMNNEYSTEIAKSRLELLSGRMFDFITERNLTEITVVSLGDLIQGILRINDVRLNEMSIVRSAVEISRLIAMFLNELSSLVYVDYYHVPKANHTQLRPLGSKPNELAEEDLEYVIGNYIKDLCLGNPRINVHLADEGEQLIKLKDIWGFNIWACHGHHLKSKNMAQKDLSFLKNEMIDYLIIGHFHGEEIISGFEQGLHDSELLVSPSFVGSCPYSDSIMVGSKSAVKIYGFNAKYGCVETNKIILN